MQDKKPHEQENAQRRRHQRQVHYAKLVTESLRDYSRRAIRSHYASLDQFLARWKTAERKEAVIDELAEEGLLLDPLLDEIGKIHLRPIDYVDPRKRVDKIPDGYNWTMDRRVYLDSADDLDYVVGLVEQSYKNVL